MATVSKLFPDGSLATSSVGSFDEYTLDNSNYGVAFNGSSQYLTAGTVSDFKFLHDASTDYTIEFWMYPTSTIGTAFIPFSTATGSAQIGIYVQLSGFTSGDIGWYVYNGSAGSYAGRVTATGAYVARQWQHVAITFTASSKAIGIYVNGVAKSTTVSGTDPSARSYSSSNSSYVLHIGTIAGASSNFFAGHFSNIRITKSLVYTSAFTPSTSPLTNITNTSLLTCQNSTISDNSTNAFAITNNGSASTDRVQTTFYKNNFSGASQYLRVPYSSAFDFSQSTWTLECWFKANAFDLVILSKDTYGTNFDFVMYVSATSIFCSTAGTAQNYSVTTGLTLSTGVWYHLAMVRSAGTLNYFLNGVKYGAGSGMGITNASQSYVTLGCYSWNNPNSFMNGSVSNLRMVQGTALYTANFTPPTQQLTAISGTTFLTHQSPTIVDNSPNAITITNFNGVTAEAPVLLKNILKRQYPDGTFQTLGDIDEYTITNSKYCIQTDTGKYLSIASSSGGTLDLTTSTVFTIEAWVYITALNSGENSIISNRDAGSTGGFDFRINTSSQLQFYYTGGSILNTTTTLSLNTWYHVAVVRNGATVTLYINGVSSATNASFSNGTNVAQKISIGGSQDDTTCNHKGYISNLRVIKGTALYTAAFTPPLTGLTAITNTQLLTCQSSTIVDNSTNAFTITNNGSVTTNNIQSTTYGANLNGGNYLSIAQAAGAIGTGTFTIEAWVRPTSFASSPTIMESSYWYQGYNGGWTSYISTSGTIIFSASNGAWNTYPTILTTTGTVPLNDWSHIAIVRDSNNFISVYINGVSAVTPVSYSASLNYNNGSIGSSYALRVGSHIADSGFYQGFSGSISNARITSTAVYTGPFLIPKRALTNITGTQFLACQSSTFIDTSSNGYGITNVSSVTIFFPIFTKKMAIQQVTGGYLIDGDFDEYSYGGTPPTSVDYLLVAGGGGGGNGAASQYESGGGGAGGFLSGTSTIQQATTYSFVIGGGGGVGGAGADSTAFNLTAIGGGGGGAYGGGSGGSGGGTWAGSPGSGTAGPPRQGYNGAGGGNNPGGGGGASAAGITNGAGGAGAEWPTGSGTYYAGGGGGGYGGSSVGGGGSGGGSPTAGTVNTGGGGGAGISTNSTPGRGGGSGVVIVRYPNTYDDAKVTTGSPTYTNTGGYKTYKFTSSGSITF